MTAHETKERAEVAGKPATRWRNWGRVVIARATYCPACGKNCRAAVGEIYGGCCKTWASKDLAETYAIEHPTPSVHYLGAYPEGETP